jgi:cysteine synthase
MTRRLARQAGLIVGISAGAAMYAAIELAHELRGGGIVTILPDDGSKYMSLGLFD